MPPSWSMHHRAQHPENQIPARLAHGRGTRPRIDHIDGTPTDARGMATTWSSSPDPRRERAQAAHGGGHAPDGGGHAPDGGHAHQPARDPPPPRPRYRDDVPRDDLPDRRRLAVARATAQRVLADPTDLQVGREQLPRGPRAQSGSALALCDDRRPANPVRERRPPSGGPRRNLVPFCPKKRNWAPPSQRPQETAQRSPRRRWRSSRPAPAGQLGPRLSVPGAHPVRPGPALRRRPGTRLPPPRSTRGTGTRKRAGAPSPQPPGG